MTADNRLETSYKPHKEERRSERRQAIDTRIAGNMDWLNSLDEQVRTGKITPQERNETISRSMTAREIINERASQKDPKTGLFNFETYKEDYAKLIKENVGFGLLILDIDHFGNFNNTFGHEAGDRVLIQTGQNIKMKLRQARVDSEENDKVYRYGGEEMVVLLPGIQTNDSLRLVAERIRTGIEGTPYSLTTLTGDQVNDKHITVSVGGGIYSGQGDSFFELVDKNALYEAKNTGRNKTVILGENNV